MRWETGCAGGAHDRPYRCMNMKLDISERRKDGTIRRTGPLWFRSLLWALLLLNMAVIFALSSKTAEESTVTSDAVRRSMIPSIRRLWENTRYTGGSNSSYARRPMWRNSPLCAYGRRDCSLPIMPAFPFLWGAALPCCMLPVTKYTSFWCRGGRGKSQTGFLTVLARCSDCWSCISF